MRRSLMLLSAGLTMFSTGLASAQTSAQHNVILFVPDGLRGRIVTPQTAPAMAELRDKGVHFKNSHSLFPTFTTANASAMATGHYLGDTGDFSNTIYTAKPIAAANGSVTPFLESDPALGEVDQTFGGDYLDETTILKAARDAGFGTAAVGKLGPVLIFDHTDRTGDPTIVVDDQTGTPNGIPLAPPINMLIGELATRTGGERSRRWTAAGYTAEPPACWTVTSKVAVPPAGTSKQICVGLKL